MKNALLGAAALLVLPLAANAQSMFAAGPSNPGFYIGAEGGLNWLMNSSNYGGITSTSNFLGSGFAVGGKVGYDFVGPRLEIGHASPRGGKLARERDGRARARHGLIQRAPPF